MKLAWVTHRDVKSRAGGAEAADMEMLERRPPGIDVTLVGPGGVDEHMKDDFDKVVVTGFYAFTSRELNELARLNPILWVHDTQFSGHWIYEETEKIIVLTPQHLEYELKHNPRLREDQFVMNPGWMDVWDYKPGEKENFALWAHRAEPHKGLDNAESWARHHNIPLEVVVGQSREYVRYRMKHAKYFLLLSHIMDPGPRSIMEAQLCGCEIIVNENVGWFDEDPSDLATRLSNADKAFWEVVCG